MQIPRTSDKTRQIIGSLLLMAVLCGLISYLAACSGSGGDSLTGAATIRGNVATFEGERTAWFAPERQSVFARMISGLADALVTPAMANLAGISVAVAGTDLFTTTTEDGFFIISGVPPGPRDLVFSRGDDSASLSIDVPANSTVQLENVRIEKEDVRVDEIEIEIREDEDSSDDLVEDSRDEDSLDDLDDDSADDVSADEDSEDSKDSLDETSEDEDSME